MISFSRCAQYASMQVSMVASPARQRASWRETRRVRRVARAAVGKDESGEGFNLEVAVILAASAFEAYLEPTEGAGLKDTAVNGTESRFFDPKFVEETYSGVLEVTAESANNLTAADPTGKSDPYAIISTGDSSASTAWKFQDLNPMWNETFLLWVRKDSTGSKLKIQVKDKDFLSSDDDLGTVFISLDELVPNQVTALELQLNGPFAGEGVVNLFATFMPFNSNESENPTLLDKVVEQGATRLVKGAPEGATSMGEAIEAMGELNDCEMRQAWDKMCNLFKDRVVSDKQTVAFIESPETDTQVWISRDVGLKKVIVSFRGTEQVKWKDFVTDANLTPADLNIEDAQDSANVLTKFLSRVESPTVHCGFLAAWKSVRGRVLAVVDDCTGNDSSWEVYVTGHSLGGALATLAAYQLSTRTGKTKYKVSMYNYGAPRVGNKAFADEYKELVSNSWRVHNEDDIVAAMPRLMGYCHVPNGVRISSEGKLTLLDRQGIDFLGEGRSAVEMFEEVSEKMTDDIEKETFLRKMYDHEMQLLQSLKGGEALASHMEDFYLEALCVMVTNSGNHPGCGKVMAEVKTNIAAFRAEALAEASKK